MNIPEIIESLTQERDRIQAAIDALASLLTTKQIQDMADHVEVADQDSPASNHVRKKPAGKPRKTPCAYNCGKEFTGDTWRLKHEADCANVVRPPASEPVARRA